MIPAEEFVSHLRNLAGHVAVVAATDPHGMVRGLTVTSLASVTADPPALVVCLSRATALPWVVRASRSFTVNLLGAEHEGLAEVFAGRTQALGPDRFDPSLWVDGTVVSPILADALASFECVVDATVERSTHDLVIGTVQAARSRAIGGRPLVRHGGRFWLVGADAEALAGTSQHDGPVPKDAEGAGSG